MKFLAPVLLAATAVAAPTLNKRAVTDVDILQFALTLEHLENVFYKGAISKWPESEFVNAGFSKDYYSNLKYIAHDEESHVELLTAALTKVGATPVAPCTYTFPYTDVRSFVALSSMLEGVGTSAYLGAAPSVQSKTYLGVAGSILVTEALHTSLQRVTLGQVPMANPYGTALGANEVYTLAASFITNCPSSNPPLPFKAFPGLTATGAQPCAPGNDVSYTTTAIPNGPAFLTFLSGLSITSVPAMIKGGAVTAKVPDTAMGQTYAVLTSKNVTDALTDDMVLAGPAILEVTPPAPTIDFSEA